MNSQSENKRKITFGVVLAPLYSWDELISQAQLLEELEFDKLWLPDHFVNPFDPNIDWFECWTLLSALAVATRKIRIGTLVTSMTLRNPAMLAKMALTIDHISNGRLELGVGAGGVSYCHKMTSVPQWSARERSLRFGEFVAVLDQMLEKKVTTFKGRYYNIQEAIMHPRPIQQPHPPLSIAAHGPKSLRLVALHGDGWNSLRTGKDLTPKESSNFLRQRYDMLKEFTAEAGRDPEEIECTFGFGYTADKPFASKEAFFDTIGRYAEAGIRDFCTIYLPGFDDFYPDRFITNQDWLQWVALEALPSIQSY